MLAQCASEPMANMENDWQLEENEQPVTAANGVPPHAPLDTQPVTNDKADVTTIVTPKEESPADDFPGDLKAALVLLKQLQGAAKLPDRPTPQQLARKAKYLRLKKHVSKLQEGLPTIQTDAHSPAAFIGLHHASLERTKLEHLARSNPLIKKLLAERDALKKENAELKTLLAKQT